MTTPTNTDLHFHPPSAGLRRCRFCPPGPNRNVMTKAGGMTPGIERHMKSKAHLRAWKMAQEVGR